MNEIIIQAEITIGHNVTKWMVQGTDNRRKTYFEETLVLRGEQIVRVTYKKAVAMEWIAKNINAAADHLRDLAQIAANKAEKIAARAARKASEPVQMAMAI